LEIFENEGVLEALQPKIAHLESALTGLKELPGVVEVRQCGFIAGLEVEESQESAVGNLAAEICMAAREHGLLTRPIGNVIVLMPPLCSTTAQVTQAVEALRASIGEVFHRRSIKNQDVEEVAS